VSAQAPPAEINGRQDYLLIQMEKCFFRAKKREKRKKRKG